MLEPPGTMRTPLSVVKRFTGIVCLSKKGWRSTSIDMSTIAPMRKPRRMPFFTHSFTRQPVRAEAQGSAARTVPAFNLALKAVNNWKCSSVYVDGRLSKTRSISACNAHSSQHANGIEDLFNLRKVFFAGRAHRQAINRL